MDIEKIKDTIAEEYCRDAMGYNSLKTKGALIAAMEQALDRIPFKGYIPYTALTLDELSLFVDPICDGDERAVKIDLSIDANDKAFKILTRNR